MRIAGIASLLAALALALAGPATAQPQSGTFEFDPEGGYETGLLLAAGLQPLTPADGEVIRFVAAQPMTWRPAVVVEIRRRGQVGEAVVVILERDGAGAYAPHREQVEIPGAAYRDFARFVDRRLDGWSPPVEATGPMADGSTRVAQICLDGPIYLLERQTATRGRWLEGFCDDDHPNNAVLRRLTELMPDDLAPVFEGLRR